MTVTETFDPINTAEDRLLLWKMMIKCAGKYYYRNEIIQFIGIKRLNKFDIFRCF